MANIEMSKQKRRAEVIKVLTMIYFEWGKVIPEELIEFWLGNLKGMRKEFVWKVARELVRRKTYGEPKFQDFWNLALELSKREQLTFAPYNPWGEPDYSPQTFLLSDMPGRMIVTGERVETFERPQPQEGRREITDHERKLLDYVNIKKVQ